MKNTKVLGVLGKKSSGKNSLANALIVDEMNSLGFNAKLNEKGQILVLTDVNGGIFGLLDINLKTKEMTKFLEETIWPHIKLYSFADPLKEFCMRVFGLSYKQCYGSDDDKNTFTGLKWEDMPGISIKKTTNINLTVHAPGYMTAREVLQYFGTDICRKMYGNAWVNATINAIKHDEPALAVITDCRFQNEVDGIKACEGGRVVKLSRSILTDTHISESGIDSITGFDYELYNSTVDVFGQAELFKDAAEKMGW
jgi:hypothetical protein